MRSLFTKAVFIVVCIVELCSSRGYAQYSCESMGWANLNGQSYVGPTTGGGNATPVQVTTFAQLKAQAESTGAKVIYVMNDMGNGYKGTSGDVLNVKSDKTIVGVKPNITVKCSWQIGQQNIIVRNLICRGPGNSNSQQNWDCVNISGSAKRIWFDHCTIMEGEDGNFDVVKGADNVTATWCKFTYVTGGEHNLSNLIGSSDNEPASHGKLNVTYAYCWWDNVNSRTPRSRYGKIHVLNCYYSRSGGTRAGFMANQRIEGCYFDNISSPIGLISDGGQSGIFVIDCHFVGASGSSQAVGGYTVFTPPYQYYKFPAKDVKSVVTNASCGAGPTLTSPTSCGCNTTPNVAPTVSISSPANNSGFAAPASITFNANAADADGTVTNVQFNNGSTLLGNAATSPYSYTWSSVAAGTYTITAVATDDKGAKTTSAPITIVVTEKPKDCAGVENGSAILDNCSRCVGGTTGKTNCLASGEAEDEACTYDGVLESKNAGFKGTSYINVPNEVGAEITFKINSVTAGSKVLSFRYASGGTADRIASINVNGSPLANLVSFPATGDFTTYKSVDVIVILNPGVNTIQLIASTADGLANIDQIGYVSSGLSKADCDVITSLEGEYKETSVSIFPNPSAGNFIINLDRNADIVIVNAEGKFIKMFSNVSELEFGNELKPGVYFAKIQNKVYKFVKY
jgi:pectate lyase